MIMTSPFGLPDAEPPIPVEPACPYCRCYESVGHHPGCWTLVIAALDEETFRREREGRWEPPR